MGESYHDPTACCTGMLYMATRHAPASLASQTFQRAKLAIALHMLNSCLDCKFQQKSTVKLCNKSCLIRSRHLFAQTALPDICAATYAYSYA